MASFWNRQRTARRRRLLKFDVMRHYSNDTMECVRCGENDFEKLSIDHLVHGTGVIERRLVNPNKPYKYNASYRFYAWLKKNNYPSGYQVLCVPCNARRNTENQIAENKRLKQRPKAAGSAGSQQATEPSNSK